MPGTFHHDHLSDNGLPVREWDFLPVFYQGLYQHQSDYQPYREYHGIQDLEMDSGSVCGDATGNTAVSVVCEVKSIWITP
jgi:hypothetical protein